MTYSVHQSWDPLRVCIVGRSYPPEFYSFIKDSKIRSILARIAQESEEDYQKLIALLQSFNVEVLRPEVHDHYQNAVNADGKISLPPMTPRDYAASIANNFYFGGGYWCPQYLNKTNWDILKGQDWPKYPETWNQYKNIPDWILTELEQDKYFPSFVPKGFEKILDKINSNANIILGQGIDSAMTLRIGKDLYFGTLPSEYVPNILTRRDDLFPEYRCHTINSGGHLDGVMCAVVPGLIITATAALDFKTLFPGWEVICLPNEDLNKVQEFTRLKERNKGRWWIPDADIPNEFIDFVEVHLNHWVGYVAESVFSVNLLVIDEKNVVCPCYNKSVFDAFERFGITPHIVNFRHRYFWDGGLHCITSDLHREGVQKDYFPERRLT